jgi:hypothetical protein
VRIARGERACGEENTFGTSPGFTLGRCHSLAASCLFARGEVYHGYPREHATFGSEGEGPSLAKNPSGLIPASLPKCRNAKFSELRDL